MIDQEIQAASFQETDFDIKEEQLIGITGAGPILSKLCCGEAEAVPSHSQPVTINLQRAVLGLPGAVKGIEAPAPKTTRTSTDHYNPTTNTWTSVQKDLGDPSHALSKSK